MTLRPPTTCLARQLLAAPRGALARRARRARSTPQCRFFVEPSTPKPSRGASTPTTPRRLSPQVAALLASVGLLSVVLSLPQPWRTSFVAVPATSNAEEDVHDDRDATLPRFRMSEVRKHDANSEHPWVVFGDKVYDITDWIAAHPGGQIILRAAGGSVEPYWNIFTIHKNQYVYDVLNLYLVGYVHQKDLANGKPAQEQIEDPFSDDPERHPSLVTRSSKPCNAETPEEALTSHFLTPNEVFYVRNHMWVPKVAEEEAEAHVLTVELLDGTTKEYTLRDLKTKFPKRQITAALQCSGNRRKDMNDGSGRKTNGLPWAAGAISNASWEGVLLADVLANAGFDISAAMDGTSDVQHVHFSAMEAYGASIPIKKAIDPQGDVLLAYGMNGKPLPRDHGYPLRSLVPGNVAARSVKWLNHIALSEEESTTQWQRRDYKCFGPNETKVDWDAATSIQELPVQSAVTSIKLGNWTNRPETGTKDHEPPAREVSLSGYAFSGGGRSIVRVDVSLDNGENWTQAYLLPDCASKYGSLSPCHGHGHWAWKRWRFNGALPLEAFKDPETKDAGDDTRAMPSGEVAETSGNTASNGQETKRCTTVVVKATDEAYNTQPESHAATWNVRGNLATAWHRVQVCTECSPPASATSTTPRNENPRSGTP